MKVECWLKKGEPQVEKQAVRLERQRRRLLGIVGNDPIGAVGKRQERPGMGFGGIVPDFPVVQNMLQEQQQQGQKAQQQNAQQENAPQQQQQNLVAADNAKPDTNSLKADSKAQEIGKDQDVKDEAQENDNPDKLADSLYQDYEELNGRFEEMPDFEQYIAQVYPTKEILERLKDTKPKKNSLQMNILIFALDSMSHLSYQRKLPKTYDYLKNNLEAFILNAYNIVGDATTAALIPLLTGGLELFL
jgi:hypothetical protein